MKTSPRGIQLIKNLEGYRESPYICAGGKLTIGYGHVLGPVERLTLKKVSRDQAAALLLRDLVSREKAVDDAVKVPINQNQFDALCSFVYNLGEASFRQSTLLRKLNARDYCGAAEEFHRWNKAGKPPRPVVGLTSRRARERALFLEVVP